MFKRFQQILAALLSIFIASTIHHAISTPTVARAQADFSCASVNEIPQIECEALVAILLANPNTSFSGWLETNTPCNWTDNIICANGRVTELELNTNGTSILGDLTNVPAEIGNLTALQSLDLSGNALTNLPSEIGNLSSLEYLSMGAYLTGGIRSGTDPSPPPGNNLVSLPIEIGNLSSLKTLVLLHNQITSLPAEIGNLDSLEELHLGANQLTELPAEIGNLTSLQVLSLGYEVFFTDPIRGGTFRFINGNNLSSLPAEISGLSSLTFIGLSGNEITDVPYEFNNLLDAAKLHLQLQGLRIEGNTYLHFPFFAK